MELILRNSRYVSQCQLLKFLSAKPPVNYHYLINRVKHNYSCFGISYATSRSLFKGLVLPSFGLCGEEQIFISLNRIKRDNFKTRKEKKKGSYVYIPTTDILYSCPKFMKTLKKIMLSDLFNQKKEASKVQLLQTVSDLILLLRVTL